MTDTREERKEEAPRKQFRVFYADHDREEWKPRNEPVSPTFNYKKRIGDLCHVMGKRRLPAYFRVNRRHSRNKLVGMIFGGVAWTWPYFIFCALLNFPQVMEVCAIVGGVGLAIDRLARWHQRRERPWL